MARTDASMTAVSGRCMTFLCILQVRLDVSVMQCTHRTWLKLCTYAACIRGSNTAHWHRKEPRLKNAPVIPPLTRRRQIQEGVYSPDNVMLSPEQQQRLSPRCQRWWDAANETLRSTFIRFLQLRACVCVCRVQGMGERGTVCFPSGGNRRDAVKWTAPRRVFYRPPQLTDISTLPPLSPSHPVSLPRAASSPLPPHRAGHAQSLPPRGRSKLVRLNQVMWAAALESN